MTDYLAYPFRVQFNGNYAVNPHRIKDMPTLTDYAYLSVRLQTEGVSTHEDKIIRELVNRYAEQAFTRMMDTRKAAGGREQTIVSDMLYTSVLFRLPENIRNTVAIQIIKDEQRCMVWVTHKSGFKAEEPIETFPSETLCNQLLVLA